jgi:heme exporter protein A
LTDTGSGPQNRVVMNRLHVDNLTCLRGARLVFEGLSFSLEAGDALLLTGPNGSGKSSLIRLLAGLLEPLDGRIAVDSEDIADDPGTHRARLAYVGHQDPIKPTLTVREDLSFWAALHGPGASDRIDEALKALDLDALADAPGRILSSGQRRRSTLARLVVSAAPLWLLDEPTVGLDTASVALVERLIADHRAAGGLVVLSSHIEIALPGGAALDLGDFGPDRRSEGSGAAA